MTQQSSAMDAAEAELQQELREMFAVDTQQHLETYFSCIQQLNDRSWQQDIQQLYRAVHTIKGGAVTVAADAMLHAAMVLEDLLSDLRYLEQAPILTDGQLGLILLEAGELLSSSIEITVIGDLAIAEVQPTVQRLIQLHERVKAIYLPDWNESKQLHQEFADQGFDLVVLELEMALGNLPAQGLVPAKTIDTARSTIEQLTQIGVDIQLTQGWQPMLADCEQLLVKPESQLWKSIWLEYFPILKNCAKNGGELTATEIDQLAILKTKIAAVEIEQSEPISIELHSDEFTAFDLPDLLDDFFGDDQIELLVPEQSELKEHLIQPELSEFSGTIDDLPDLLDNFFVDEQIDLVGIDALAETSLEAVEIGSKSIASVDQSSSDLVDSLDNFFVDPDIDLSGSDAFAETSFADGPIDNRSIASADEFNSDLVDSLDNFFIDGEIELVSDIDELMLSTEPVSNDKLAVEQIVWTIESPAVASIPAHNVAALSVPTPTDGAIENPVESVKRNIQIPVPLERLDKSAQQVVDTLLTARAVMNGSNQLQSQLHQLTNLTQESAQYVTRLRQLQDDYALLRNLSDERDSSNNVSLERYRQGYTTINRLLENILRMSELGQEIETATYQSANRLDALDRSILRLKDGIETSRLVPFRNLTLRAKAILRDLTNRYGKPAELIVQNEQVELDAGIVQQIEPALLHLLRNAYDHGLESRQDRLDAGKSAQAKINVSLHRRGNLYRLVIADNGRGIDPQKIEQLARSKGFPLHQTQTNAELLAVLCQAGFSSSSAVSEVSGRGVGMDVVVAQIASIGGKLSLETTLGQGTTFSIEVPAPQLLVPCILLQVGERVLALPTDEVLETALLSSMAAASVTATDDNQVSLCNWLLTTNQGQVPGFDLANYWQPAESAGGKLAHRSFPESAICIRTRQADGTAEIWSIADDLLGQSELLINPLPSPLIAPAGLLGVSLQPDGRMISILDPIALTMAIMTMPNQADTAHSDRLASQSVTPAKPSAPTILIVDDAAMMRRRFEASLNNNGFITHTCNDGLEALNWLENNLAPDLMITDVEMPNMDGFTLIDRCRQANIDIPILVVSSRLSAEWGKEARRLGASDYLNKGFSTSELLQKVNSLIGLAVIEY